jgi:hypothetical protein
MHTITVINRYNGMVFHHRYPNAKDAAIAYVEICRDYPADIVSLIFTFVDPNEA